MKGRLYIDGVDAYTRYRISVANGGYSGLAALPPLKKVEAIDWHEEDGVDVDLSAPALDTFELQVKFTSQGDMGVLLATLSDGAYHEFDFKEVERVCRLRLASQASFKTLGGLHEFTLQLANDFPLDGYAYAAPQSALALPPAGYEIDYVDLSAYGVTVLMGSLAGVVKLPPVKKNLLRSVSTSSGALYDSGNVTFQQKDVTLKCLMQAATIAELWRNRDALLFDLSRPEKRTLYARALNEEYQCYYKSSAVERFAATGKIWLAFSLTLVITSFKDDAILLADNKFSVITTSDGKLIELSETLLADKQGIFIATNKGNLIEI
ncbi:MAG: hypothetical protein LBF67_09635 [Prevotellaceae bacterium]|jgi:hypothetical protein|nr:hypothetical protein [Prevotellaceae bacterium]